MKERVAAVVVGAGPAGAISALLLAREGHPVILLDRRGFPRAKPCGDCISAGANRLLDEIGLLAPILELKPARLEAWRLYSPSGTPLELRFDDTAPGDERVAVSLALSRERLDAALVDQARSAGADVRLGVRVERLEHCGSGVVVTGRDGHGAAVRIEARLVIGADGLRSTVARSIGAFRRAPRLRKLSLTAHLSDVRGVGAAGELHFGDGLCAGVAPVDADATRCNVTLVAGVRHGRDVARDAHAFFFAALESFPALRGRVPRPPAGAGLLASGPFDWPTRRVTADRIALVGDAAGYYDPLTGQGIHQAVAGAMALTRHASDALRSDAPLSAALDAYAREQARLAGPPRQLQRLLELSTARPARAERALRRLARARRAALAVLAATSDVAHPAALLSPLTLLSFASPRLLENRS